MIGEIATLFVSLLVLWRSSDLLVENSLALANYFHASKFVIGFLLLSVATSLPELSIAVTSLWEGHSILSVGNVLGANVSDITLVLGASIFVASAFALSEGEKHKARNFLAVAALLPFLLYFFPSFLTSLFLIACFFGFAFLASKQHSEYAHTPVSRKKALFSALFFAFGLVLLVVSADFSVRTAVSLAGFLGISSVFVGATLVSLGTTLPELTVNLQAVRKRDYSLVLGNSVGSTVVNSTLVLGVGSFLQKSFSTTFLVLCVLFLLIAMLSTQLLSSQKQGRKAGLVLLAAYLVFLFASASSEIFLKG